GPRLPGSLAGHFAQKHPRDPNTISRNVADLLAPADFPCAAIDRLISVLVRRRTPAPLEEPNQVAANLQVTVRSHVAVGPERSQQGVKGLLRECPLLPRRLHGADYTVPGSDIFATRPRMGMHPDITTDNQVYSPHTEVQAGPGTFAEARPIAAPERHCELF